LVAIGGGADIGYAQVKTRTDQLQAALTVKLQAGQAQLEAGKASLSQANGNHDSTLVAAASAHFAKAKIQFVAAGALADNSTLLRDLEMVPSLGSIARSKHAVVSGLSAMGAALSDAGVDLAVLDGGLIEPAASGQAGHSLLTALTDAHAGLTKVRGDLDRAKAASDHVDVTAIPEAQQATFTKARADIGIALSGLDEFDRLTPVMIEVLGGNGPRNYLVEQVNPAELRAGGGFIGTYSLIRADQGALTVVRSGDAYGLADPRPQPGQKGFIPQPTPYREIVPAVSWSFVDSNIYPDFGSNAVAAENFVNPRLGLKLDAVISMDYYTVAKMLELTGPITVSGFGTLTSSNFISTLIPGDIAGDARHKAALAAVAGPLMERVAALPPDRWPTLISTLNGLVGERHLQAYFNNPSTEDEIARVGWSGSLRPTGARDFMMEIESNYYGTKSNYFLTRHFTVQLARNGNLLHHTVIVDLVNNEPGGLEPRETYKADIRLYVSSNVTSASDNLTPVRYANPPSPDGTTFMDGWLDVICCGGRGRAVFQYDTPWPSHDDGTDEVYLQKQPGTVADKIDVIWKDGFGHVYQASSAFGEDLVLRLSLTNVTVAPGHPAQASLPSLNLG
jgi:hypothetical protein